MISNPRIALIVDHPRRDLSGLVLTALEMCREGAVCYLVPSNHRRREIWALAPDAVVLYNARRSNANLATQLGPAGIRFGLLDTEGGVWARPADYAELLWDDRALRRAMKFVCAWGPGLASYLESEALFSADQLRVTGCPRFDFYAPRWRGVWQQNGNGPPPQRRILVNTLFSEVNQKYATLADNMTYFRDIYGWSGDRVEAHFTTQQRAMGETLEMIRSLARDYPDCQVVVRPHPFEDPEFYEKQLGGDSGIEINATGAVQEQIFRAAVVIQRSCTTAFEAGMARVPALSPQWIDAPYLQPEAEAVSVPVASYAEMRQHIDAILAGGFRVPDPVTERIEELVHRWFYAMDGSAHRRVTETVLERLPGSRSVSAETCRRNLYAAGTSWQKGRVKLRERLRSALGLPPQWSFRKLRVDPGLERWAESDRYFDATEVGRLASAVDRGMREQGLSARPVIVQSAEEAGQYPRRYRGYSVLLAPQ